MRVINMKKILTIIVGIILFTSFFVSIEKATRIQKTNPINKIENLPSSFSWRDIDGIDYTTPIKNQAPAPTCEAYALCASLETKMQYKKGEIYTPDLSETHLYFYANGSTCARDSEYRLYHKCSVLNP